MTRLPLPAVGIFGVLKYYELVGNIALTLLTRFSIDEPWP